MRKLGVEGYDRVEALPIPLVTGHPFRATTGSRVNAMVVREGEAVIAQLSSLTVFTLLTETSHRPFCFSLAQGGE